MRQQAEDLFALAPADHPSDVVDIFCLEAIAAGERQHIVQRCCRARAKRRFRRRGRLIADTFDGNERREVGQKRWLASSSL